MCKELYQINELIESHAHLVPFFIAKYFRVPDGHDKDELISIGYEALVLAARKYNPEIARFSTFAAIKIRGAVLNYFRKEKRRSRIAPFFSMDKVMVDEGVEFHELIGDESTVYEDRVVTEVVARQALDCLEGDELEIVMSYYGIDTGCPVPLPAIGKAIGVSRTVAWSRKEKALHKMRKAVSVG